FVEIIIPKALIGAPAQVNAMLDINDLVFLLTQYAETQYKIVDPYSDFDLPITTLACGEEGDDCGFTRDDMPLDPLDNLLL
ncbi:MAG TPA: hypothetical protein VLA17_08920, partial [Candidatus Limnocylindria bacterium]|nr:hypothetical protein [Candidatus Limnocylindria bacterium]